MTLPKQIPRKLRARALDLPELQEGEAAWSEEDAVSVIEALHGSTVAISSVVIYGKAPWGYAPSDVAWSMERRGGESDSDLARRSREGAREFIKTAAAELSDALFALAFDVWKDAA